MLKVRARLLTVTRRCYGTDTNAAPLRRTPLYPLHVSQGAKMVPFAGYEMPLSYGDVGQLESHKYVRSKAGLFDVGHMMQTNFTGPAATAFLEWLTPSSLSTLAPFTSTLSLLLNSEGGIIDDCVITKHCDEEYYVVSNAGRRVQDLAWFKEKLNEFNGKVEMELLESFSLIALQGPLSASILQSFTPINLRALTFGKSAFMPFDDGFRAHVTRGGYTGEDGFELSVAGADVVEFTHLLTSDKNVMMVGLGARDSLRLEAGMCLYGNDLDETIGPVEAGLGWVVSKRRRRTGGFIGFENVARTFSKGVQRRRVGLIVEGAPARQGAKIFAQDQEIGTVTSGIPSPSLGKNIAMAYVQTGHHKSGTQLEVEVRGKKRQATVVPMPFVPTRYWKGD